MLEPTEIRAGMAYPSTFKALGDKRTQSPRLRQCRHSSSGRGAGCALVEAITGEAIERTVAWRRATLPRLVDHLQILNHRCRSGSRRRGDT